jgi:hypothetical protein
VKQGRQSPPGCGHVGSEEDRQIAKNGDVPPYGAYRCVAPKRGSEKGRPTSPAPLASFLLTSS